MKLKVMKILFVVVIALLILSFLPLWPKPVKSGTVFINTWTKIQVMQGKLFID